MIALPEAMQLSVGNICLPFLCPFLQVMKKGDVLLEYDGVPIANDGTVHLRHRERIYFSYLITLKPTGATSKIKVRGGARGRSLYLWH